MNDESQATAGLVITPGLIRAVWGVVVALAAAAAAIFWAGYHYFDINSKLQKIPELEEKLSHMEQLNNRLVKVDELDMKFSYIERLPNDPKLMKSPLISKNAPAVMCDTGEVVRGIQWNESQIQIYCGRLVPLVR
jgi:hypothetical protein